jgi:hypothetical protein
MKGFSAHLKVGVEEEGILGDGHYSRESNPSTNVSRGQETSQSVGTIQVNFPFISHKVSTDYVTLIDRYLLVHANCSKECKILKIKKMNSTVYVPARDLRPRSGNGTPSAFTARGFLFDPARSGCVASR